MDGCGVMAYGSSSFDVLGSWLLKAASLILCLWLPDLVNLSLNDNDGSSGASDQDTLAPLPGATPWPLLPTFSYQYPAPHPYSPQPPPYHELSSYTYGGGSASSQHSEGKLPPGSRGAGAGDWGGRGTLGEGSVAPSPSRPHREPEQRVHTKRWGGRAHGEA